MQYLPTPSYTLSNDSMADFINEKNEAFFDLDKRSDIIWCMILTLIF